MTDRIIRALGLPSLEPDSLRRIRIEDITTEEERRIANQQREQLGKHVIPAPSMQLKRTFSGYFMDPLRFFRGKDQGAASERTVVRPTYSYMGDYFVAEKVIDDIVTCLARLTPAIGRVIYVVQNAGAESYHLKIGVKIKKGYPIWESAMDFQSKIEEEVEKMTAFNVTEIELEVRGIN